MQRDTPAAAIQPGFAVLTANIHMGFDMLHRRMVLPRLREAIRGVGADLVFLQEVQGSHREHARHWRDWPQVPQYEYLADTLWSDFAYGRNAAYPHGHHGNALLSRFPITHYANHDVTVAGHEGRGLLHCQLEMPGEVGMVHAICVHLGLRRSHRQRQLQLLGELVRVQVPAEAPLVVAGDFNDWRCGGHRQLRDHGLVEAYESRHGHPARSFPAVLPLLRLDRIYVRGLQVQAAVMPRGTPWSGLSDHLPLYARLGVEAAG